MVEAKKKMSSRSDLNFVGKVFGGGEGCCYCQFDCKTNLVSPLKQLFSIWLLNI
jgi:hypothetical protein